MGLYLIKGITLVKEALSKVSHPVLDNPFLILKLFYSRLPFGVLHHSIFTFGLIFIINFRLFFLNLSLIKSRSQIRILQSINHFCKVDTFTSLHLVDNMEVLGFVYKIIILVRLSEYTWIVVIVIKIRIINFLLALQSNNLLVVIINIFHLLYLFLLYLLLI